MSYAAIQPEFYHMLEPGTPWHPGSADWKDKLWVTWGDNPNLVGPPRQGVGGCGCSGAVGEDASADDPATAKRGLILAASALGAVALIAALVSKKRR
jgi:hypothetical protein